jgi:hypothetical protein
MEFYHNQLKLRLLNEKDPGVYQRADWLVDKLGTKVHSYFWLDEYSGKDDFSRYWRDEWVSGLTSWRKALKIPDSDVVIEGRCAKVADQLNQDKAYVVWNPGSQFGICNCSWAEMGNLCEHMIKVINICRKRGSTMPSISLLQYHKALIDMLHCPPHDSLIRDHAVSLAVCVQKQLNALVDLDSSQTTLDTIQKHTVDNIEQESVEMVSSNQDRDIVNESNCMDDGVSSHDENCDDVNDAPDSIRGDVDGEMIDMVTGGNDICGENAGEEIPCAEMDVEPSSICISPPGLYSVDEVVASNVFSEDGDRVSTEPPPNDALSDGNRFQDDILNKDCHESMMDVESQSIDVPPSTREFQEQCTVTHQNDLPVNDFGPTVSSTPDTDPKTSPSISLPVESQVVDMVETSGVFKENEGIELKSIHDHSADDSDVSHDAKAVGSMMAEHTEL